MSVYTSISRSELEQFLQHYSLGTLTDFNGISDGIENTNYAVHTTSGSYILTLFESIIPAQVAEYIVLLKHLSTNSFPCPTPIPDRQGAVVQQLKHKPAALFVRLPGISIDHSSPAACNQIGQQLARLHLSAQNCLFKKDNPTDLSWMQQQLKKNAQLFSSADYALLTDELAFQQLHTDNELKQGIIHADLFKDNVLFVDGNISGIVDFYNACIDSLLLDIAISANDWCYVDGTIRQDLIDALFTGYESVRALTGQEKRLWPVMLRRAALRFWLSRLLHQFFPREGEITQQKDPSVFRRILQQHRQPYGPD